MRKCNALITLMVCIFAAAGFCEGMTEEGRTEKRNQWEWKGKEIPGNTLSVERADTVAGSLTLAREGECTERTSTTLTCSPSSVTMAEGESRLVTVTLKGSARKVAYIYFVDYEAIFSDENPAVFDLLDLMLLKGTYRLKVVAVDEENTELASTTLTVTVAGEVSGPVVDLGFELTGNTVPETDIPYIYTLKATLDGAEEGCTVSVDPACGVTINPLCFDMVEAWGGGSYYDFYYQDIEIAFANPGNYTITIASPNYSTELPVVVVGDTEPTMPVLRVDRADPTEGSLTLAWEDEGGGEWVTYSLWRGAGKSRAEAVCVTNGLDSNQRIWTDKEYWKAEPVLEPLRYWVVAEGCGAVRESEPMETRHRYGVFVGVNEYAKNFENLLILNILNANVQAELFGRLARENGFAAPVVLTGSGATKAAFHKALKDVADKAKTGDYVAVFCCSHGKKDFWGWYSTRFEGICLHDTVYGKDELASDLKTLATSNDKNGLNVVIFLNTCYSGGAVSASPAGQHFAWIVACRESEEATTVSRGTMGAMLPHFLLEYGWNQGAAGGGPGTMATFADLCNYAMPAMDNMREIGLIDEHPGAAEPKVLKHFIAGRLGEWKHTSLPDVPSGLTVSSGEDQLHVAWNWDPNADYYILRVTDQEDHLQRVQLVPQPDDRQNLGGKDPHASWYGEISRYRVAALNEHGMTLWSKYEDGYRKKYALVQWLIDQGELLGKDIRSIAELAASPSANGMSLEGCYVSGIDPLDPNAAFEAELVREDGKWKAKPVGGEKEGRVYSVEGKRAMTDEEWTDVTEVEDLAGEGWRFFRVGVRLDE